MTNSLITEILDTVNKLRQDENPSKLIAEYILQIGPTLTIGERKLVKAHFSALANTHKDEHFMMVGQMII